MLGRVGNCEICFELASGGTATVYLGVQQGAEGFEKIVAVKRLLPELSFDSQFVAMLVDEAVISGRAHHPAVRDVYDLGLAEDGTHYLTMEFLMGEPLSRVFRGLSSRPQEALGERHQSIVARVISGLAEGLHTVHELSEEDGPLLVVHRDVTPSNLFVLHDGSVRVTDFGIARARVRRQSATGNALKGKLPYMSPEYVSRQPYDRRSDVWALGVVAWELLTGVRLFRKGSDLDTAQAIVREPIPAPSSVNCDVDRRLDGIVLRALCREPGSRHSTALELARDLDGYLGSGPFRPLSDDVAQWLSELVPGSRASLGQLVEQARRMAFTSRARTR